MGWSAAAIKQWQAQSSQDLRQAARSKAAAMKSGSEFLKNLGTGIESCEITASTHAEEKDTTPYGLIVSSAAASLD